MTYRVKLGGLLLVSAFISGCVNVPLAAVSATQARNEQAMQEEIRRATQDPNMDERTRNERLFELLKLSAEWDLPLTRQLVQQGVPVNYPNGDQSYTNAHAPLYTATEKGQLEIARYLLDQGANPNGALGVEGWFKFYPLTKAVEAGNPAMVELLLSHGANPNAVDSGGVPLLESVAQRRLPDIAKLLTAAGGVAKPSEAQSLAHLQPDYAGTVARIKLQVALQHDDWPAAQAILEQYPQYWSQTDAQGAGLSVQVMRYGAVDCLAHLQQEAKWSKPTPDQVNEAMNVLILAKKASALARLLKLTQPKGPLLAAKSQAITHQDASSLRVLLDYNPVTDGALAGQMNLLQLAVSQPSTELTQLLLEYKVSVLKISDAEPLPPLELAISKRQLVQANLLLDKGARPQSISSLEKSAIYSALNWGQDSLALRLLKQERSLPADRRDALYSLSIEKMLPVSANWLASKGAKLIDTRDAKGNSMLAKSIQNKNETMFEQLLAGGADPHQKTPAGASMLHIAARASWLPGVEQLLALGLNPVATDKSGDTPVSIAAYKDNQALLAVLLGAVPSIQGNESWMREALANSVQYKLAQNLELLLAAGGNPNFYDSKGQSLLYQACDSSRSDSMVPLLLAAGANIEQMNQDGEKETPLFAAGLRGNMKTVAMLIQAGARINRTDAYGRTVLDKMITNGHSERSVWQMQDMGARARAYPELLESYSRKQSADDSNIWASTILKAAGQLEREQKETMQQSYAKLMAQIRAGEQRKAQLKQQGQVQSKSNQSIQAGNAKMPEVRPKASESHTLVLPAPAQPKTQTKLAINSGAGGKKEQVSSKPEIEAKRPVPTHGEAQWGSLDRTDGNGKLSGKFNQANFNVGSCALIDLDIGYDISYMGHDPLVFGHVRWKPGPGTDKQCIPQRLLSAWLKLENGSAHGYVLISHSSPAWDRLICSFDGDARKNCFPKEQAREFIRGARVTGYRLSHE